MSIGTIVGKRMKTLREGRSWTQAELSRRSDVAPSTIMRYERGRKNSLSVPTLLKIAAALGVSLDYIVGRDSNFKPHDEDG